MATRAPYFDFMLGNKSLDDLGIRHLIESIEFEEKLGSFDKITMVVNDGAGLEFASDLAKHGAVLQLSMGYFNESILPMTACFMFSMEPDFSNQKVTFAYMNYLKAMDQSQRDRTLSNVTIQDIVVQVVADYEILEVGTIENGSLMLSDTTSQSKQTDFKLLEGIASQFGMKWKIEPSQTKGKWTLSLYKLDYDKSKVDNYLPLHAYPDKEYQAETKSLKLKTFKPKSNILGVSSSVQIRSNNPNQPIDVQSTSKDPTTEPTVVRGSEIVATVFGERTTIHFYENVSDEQAAQIIADQLQQEDELSFVVAPDCQLSEGIPNLRVGDVRHVVCHGIRMFEKVFTGDYLVTGTKHKISSSSGYDTWVTMNMNALSVPPPPEGGFGGGGNGVPVLIRVVHGGTENNMFGWYVNQNSEGVVSLGATITNAEILANSYWMEHVNNSIRFYFNNNQTPAVGRDIVVGAGETVDWTNLARVATGGSGAFTDVRIDWPDEWRTSITTLATSVNGDSGTELIESYYEAHFGESSLEGLSDSERTDALFSQRAFELEAQANANAVQDAVRHLWGGN